jgi:hypothetical protein
MRRIARRLDRHRRHIERRGQGPVGLHPAQSVENKTANIVE